MSNAHERQAPTVRVSTIELFFDLVFVFTITQVTHLVEEVHAPLDLLRAFLVLVVIWWMFAAYAWLTNNTGADRRIRLVMIAAQAGFLVMALSIPHVFGVDGLAFGFAYLFVIVLHLATFALSGGRRALRPVLALAPFNLASGMLVLIAGAIEAEWDWLLWLTAALMPVGATAMGRERPFTLNPEHFVERHGLLLLIALGESVVSIGVGAAGIEVGLPIVAVAVLALLLIACLWWSYFDRDDVRAEHVMMRATPEERSRIALRGYWYCYLVMLAGIVLASTGIKEIVAHLAEPSGAAAWYLASGIALYLLGDAGFRAVLGIKPIATRLTAAALAFASVTVGLTLGGAPELAALVVLLVAMLGLEEITGRRRIAE